MSDQKRIPRHVAIIMDGNGRWATARGKERFEGHVQGVEAMRRVLRAAKRHGVHYLTLYAFSTENWGRPAREVDALMELFCRCSVSEAPALVEDGVRVRIIGDLERLPEKVRKHLEEFERKTAGGKSGVLLLAINYSSRNELTRAARALAQRVAEGGSTPGAISEQSIAGELDTAGYPEPDLVIRTGGEQRLSNFLLWQAAYAELYFTPVLWPDFGAEEFAAALDEYAARERRFGLVKNG